MASLVSGDGLLTWWLDEDIPRSAEQTYAHVEHLATSGIALLLTISSRTPDPWRQPVSARCDLRRRRSYRTHWVPAGARYGGQRRMMVKRESTDHLALALFVVLALISHVRMLPQLNLEPTQFEAQKATVTHIAAASHLLLPGPLTVPQPTPADPPPQHRHGQLEMLITCAALLTAALVLAALAARRDLSGWRVRSPRMGRPLIAAADHTGSDPPALVALRTVVLVS